MKTNWKKQMMETQSGSFDKLLPQSRPSQEGIVIVKEELLRYYILDNGDITNFCSTENSIVNLITQLSSKFRHQNPTHNALSCS